MKKTLKKGFTLVELVIVIAVIAILSAVLIPTFGNVISNAKKSAAQSEASNAISQYVTNAASNKQNADLPDGYVLVLSKRVEIATETSVSTTWKNSIDYVFAYTKGAVDTDSSVKYDDIDDSVYDIIYNGGRVYDAETGHTLGTGEGEYGTLSLSGSTLSTYGVYLLDYTIADSKVTAKVILLAKKSA